MSQLQIENEAGSGSEKIDEFIDEMADSLTSNEVYRSSANPSATLSTTRCHKQYRRQKVQAELKVKGLLGESIQKAQRCNLRDFALLRMQSTNNSSHIIECSIQKRPFLVLVLKRLIRSTEDMAVYDSEFVRKEVETQQKIDMNSPINQSISSWNTFLDSGCKIMQLIVTPPQRHTLDYHSPSTQVKVYAPCYFSKKAKLNTGCQGAQWYLWTPSLLTVDNLTVDRPVKKP